MADGIVEKVPKFKYRRAPPGGKTAVKPLLSGHPRGIVSVRLIEVSA